MRPIYNAATGGNKLGYSGANRSFFMPATTFQKRVSELWNLVKMVGFNLTKGKEPYMLNPFKRSHQNRKDLFEVAILFLFIHGEELYTLEQRTARGKEPW